jgi:hypothetical protein
MSITGILVQAQVLGVELVVADGKLRWSCGSKPPEDFLSLLRQHKKELLDAITPVVYGPEDWDSGEPIFPPVPKGARIIFSPSKCFWTWAGAPRWFCGSPPC